MWRVRQIGGQYLGNHRRFEMIRIWGKTIPFVVPVFLYFSNIYIDIFTNKIIQCLEKIKIVKFDFLKTFKMFGNSHVCTHKCVHIENYMTDF